jgi:DNA-binding transcriptional MerR regulator
MMKQLDLFGFAEEPAEKKTAQENRASEPEENKKEVVEEVKPAIENTQENTLIFSNAIFGVKVKLKEVPEEKVAIPSEEETFPADEDAPAIQQPLIEPQAVEPEIFIDENIVVEEPLVETIITPVFEEEVFPVDEDAPVIQQSLIEPQAVEPEIFIDENIAVEEPLIEATITPAFEEEVFPVDEEAPVIQQPLIKQQDIQPSIFIDENITVEEPLNETTAKPVFEEEIFRVNEDAPVIQTAKNEAAKTDAVTEFSLSIKQKPKKETKPAAKNKRGRKSFKDIDAEIELVDVPEDDVLFEKQYYTISIVAKWFNVNTSLIRYWENEFDILKPRKNRKGDRLFRPEDVKNIQVIYYLLRQRKFSLEGAKSYLKQNKQKADTDIQLIQSLTKFRSFLLELKANLEI